MAGGMAFDGGWNWNSDNFPIGIRGQRAIVSGSAVFPKGQFRSEHEAAPRE